MPESPPPALPLLDAPPRERADAARNRALVLQAAWRLYTHGGVEALTTDAVAQEAGVGKGTVYRRFRDKSGLVAALLDDKEKELQLAMISGPAPLGPEPLGQATLAPATTTATATAPSTAVAAATHTERRVAFVHAYLDYLQAHLDLLLAAETAAPGARYRLGVYQFWKTHLTMLFTEDPDSEFRAYTVLALLDAGLVSHLLADGWGWDRVRAGAEREARR
ncbi:TetR/AcrR family transcriptional regulator [Catenulispora sp. NF23]|uniref:TetR/AcrR family transcriptional regulator n=1 Tax=Catenulispora pinistramenti TaxID=2705254 RepID=UPI001BAAD88A|nr:TetR/AcrR family transcriptional regulator [Catenulispora pinistramenti]MBS2532581.1 TetR/AcrR family transcriptional regulator [Catenulispora pinistramenti]